MAYGNAQPAQIRRDAWYNLNVLATLFDCKPATLRRAIREKLLKARKRARTWVVKGSDALSWWNS
jgi:hypothetical protein